MRLNWPRPSLGLLRDRDYRLYWTGESISTMGSAVSVVAMPLTAVLVLHAGAFLTAPRNSLRRKHLRDPPCAETSADPAGLTAKARP